MECVSALGRHVAERCERRSYASMKYSLLGAQSVKDSHGSHVLRLWRDSFVRQKSDYLHGARGTSGSTYPVLLGTCKIQIPS